MSVSLIAVDNVDGSGITATVAGAGGSDSLSVYFQPAAQRGRPDWALGGTRTGNGTVTLSVPAGYYWLHCVDAVGPQISNIVYQLASDDTLAVHERLIMALKATIQSLTLVGNPPVIDQMFPNESVITLPCILLTVEDMQETQPGTLTGKDDIGYPVRVSICDRNDGMVSVNRAKYLLWRQQIFRAIRNTRLPAVAESAMVFVEPAPIVDKALPQYQFLVSSMVARCISREFRGV